MKKQDNQIVILYIYISLLPTGAFCFSDLLTMVFPNVLSTETQQMQIQLCHWSTNWPRLSQIPSITAFWDHYFHQFGVLNLLWRLNSKLNGPTEYYHSPLLTIFLCFKWSLNCGITRHYAKTPILFKQFHYPTFCLLWFS